jgi:hypothetical protein
LLRVKLGTPRSDTGDRGQGQAACQGGVDRGAVMVVLQELGEFDHAEDGEDQRQAHVRADWPDLQLCLWHS